MKRVTAGPTWITHEDITAFQDVMNAVDGVEGGGGGDDDSGEGQAKRPRLIKGVVKKAAPKPVGLISRQLERDILGEPKNRERCFGCCYIGEYDTAAMADEEVTALFNMIRKSYARTNHIALAIHVAAKYREIQEDRNAHLYGNDQPLPDWDEATILEHLRSHNTDPELQLWQRLTEMQELAQIALNAAVELDPDTGNYSVNEKQAKIYLGEFVLFFLFSCDPVDFF